MPVCCVQYGTICTMFHHSHYRAFIVHICGTWKMLPSNSRVLNTHETPFFFHRPSLAFDLVSSFHRSSRRRKSCSVAYIPLESTTSCYILTELNTSEFLIFSESVIRYFDKFANFYTVLLYFCFEVLKKKLWKMSVVDVQQMQPVSRTFQYRKVRIRNFITF